MAKQEAATFTKALQDINNNLAALKQDINNNMAALKQDINDNIATLKQEMSEMKSDFVFVARTTALVSLLFNPPVLFV